VVAINRGIIPLSRAAAALPETSEEELDCAFCHVNNSSSIAELRSSQLGYLLRLLPATAAERKSVLQWVQATSVPVTKDVHVERVEGAAFCAEDFVRHQLRHTHIRDGSLHVPDPADKCTQCADAMPTFAVERGLTSDPRIMLQRVAVSYSVVALSANVNQIICRCSRHIK
jgi:hypothetical protein